MATCLLTLNRDMILQVMSYLLLHEIFRCKITCRQLNDVIDLQKWYYLIDRVEIKRRKRIYCLGRDDSFWKYVLSNKISRHQMSTISMHKRISPTQLTELGIKYNCNDEIYSLCNPNSASFMMTYPRNLSNDFIPFIFTRKYKYRVPSHFNLGVALENTSKAAFSQVYDPDVRSKNCFTPNMNKLSRILFPGETFLRLMTVYDNFNWNYLTSNPAITIEFIVQHQYLPWIPHLVVIKDIYTSYLPAPTAASNTNWYNHDQGRALSSVVFGYTVPRKINEQLRAQISTYVCKCVDYVYDNVITAENMINIIMFSANEFIPLEFIEKRYKYDWNFNLISARLDIPIEEKLKKSYLPWNWNFCVNNARDPFSIIKAHPNIPWNYDLLSLYGHFTIDDIARHSEIKWNWILITLNKNLKFMDIVNNLHLPFDSRALSTRDDIDFDYVAKHPDVMWYKDALYFDGSIAPIVIISYNKNKPNLLIRLNHVNTVQHDCEQLGCTYTVA